MRPVPDVSRQVTKWHCIEWYDGPHCEIRGVRTPPQDALGSEIIEVRQWASEVEMRPVRGGETMPYATLRLTREDLQQMLALLDGGPVCDEPDCGYKPAEWKPE